MDSTKAAPPTDQRSFYGENLETTESSKAAPPTDKAGQQGRGVWEGV